jgi:TorA maturation chaperone TorD
MQAAAAPVQVHRPLPPEEAARGDFYALLANLFHRGPDAVLLGHLARAEPIAGEGARALSVAWRDLADASSAMDADAAGEEYERLFVGVGKAPVSIYAGHYAGAMAVDHPRVRLQADLEAFGLERRAGVHEPEDHFAGLFDVMRVLVAGGPGRAPAPLADQRRFFEAYLQPGAARFLGAIARSEHSNYYRKVAALAEAFLALETESFQLD